jgi:two-component system cell cycle sensor histidine kinase/response regulator CckA
MLIPVTRLSRLPSPVEELQLMSGSLRVLYVEDSERDAALLGRHLARAGYKVISERVDAAEPMNSALISQDWDIILCDYSMPQFNSLSALAILKQVDKDIPFIIVSGTIGEEAAVEVMRAGAHDYLMKDKLTRLVPTIERELQEARGRHARRMAETALRESEDRYRDLVENSHDLICTHDLEGRLLSINRTAAKSLGFAPDALLGRNIREAILPEFVDRFDRYISALLERGAARGLMALKTRTGERRVWEYSNSLRIDGVAVPIVRGVAHDVTEKKRAEAALRKSEDRYRDLVENARDIIYTHDLQGNFTSINRAGEQITGYSRKEVLTINLTQIVAPQFREKVRKMLEGKLANEKETVYDLEIFAKDGRHVAVEVNTRFIYQDAVPVGMQGIARDVTERKQLEEQLRQSQKMEAVGMLAGGIAHDFNNLLTAITGYSDLGLRRLKAEDPLRHNLEEIKKAGNRAASLTRQLLAFSRKQVLQPKVLDLNWLVLELGKLLRRLIGEDVELRTVPGTNLGSVRADPGQIEQVIVNLAVNARDAMPHGGSLTIETGNVYLDAEYAGQHIAVTPGPYVMLAVTDTGTGMDELTRERIFEPFFTTKEVDKGTGLGLSTVYGIVKQSGGNIWVYSEVGRGTTFKIYLPRVDEGAEKLANRTRSEEDLRGTETILIAEDEQTLRNLARQVLEMYGYRVLEAATGSEAVLICENHNEPIHLLITDVVMPRMGGRELADRLGRLRPEMSVIYMSGYTNSAIVHQGVLNDDASFIQKPFAPEELAIVVKKVLNPAR